MVSAVEVLSHGQIDLSGLVTSTPSGPGTFQLAVTGGTGGTGGYQDARGYAIVVQATPRRSPSTSPRDRQPNGPRPAGRDRPHQWRTRPRTGGERTDEAHTRGPPGTPKMSQACATTKILREFV
ncbi:MAG TPA: hypothetical protein VLW50_33035 [Streptosporangiaceae bacterium]|nr:hypothetical protein [Streptosporangiaceae bacterium]